MLDPLDTLIDLVEQLVDADAAIKAGKRNASSDQALIDQGYDLAEQLCDLFTQLGATGGEDDETAEMGADDEQDMEEGMEGKAIAKRDDVSPKEGLSNYGNVTFADEKNKRYPIDTEAHIRAAWNYINQDKNAAKYEAAEVATIKRKIVAAWKNTIDKAGPPSAATKGIEFLDDDLAVLMGDGCKAIGNSDGLVGGYLVKFGGNGDLSEWRDVFDQTTDYERHTKSDVWVHHRMLPGLGKRRLTNQADIGMDDEGIFIKHLLDLRSSYERKLYGMVQADKLGWSSGTAPHLVERKALPDGRHAIEQWILGLDASYTPMPAGGMGVEARASAMKSLCADAGIDLLNAIYSDQEANETTDHERPDAVKVDADRARRLALELQLLALETVV